MRDRTVNLGVPAFAADSQACPSILDLSPPDNSSAFAATPLPCVPERTHWFQLLIALFWGGLTAFAMASESDGAMLQAGGLLVAWILSLICSGCMALLAWSISRAGWFLIAHVAVAVASGFLGGSEIESILRYLALVPAFSIVLAVVLKGESATDQFRIGLTLAGFSLVVFHLFYLERESIFDPSQRLSVFLNTNTLGFMAVMTAVSALDFACTARRKSRRILWAGVSLLCVIIWLSTKSRTALVALAAGVLTLAVLRYELIEVVRFQFSKRPLLLSVLLLGVMAIAFHRKDFVVDVLSLQDDYRSVESATGRYEIWKFILTDIWPSAPWIGIGPGNHGELVRDATSSSSAHNGLLMALAETGVCGTIPLLLIIGLCFRVIIRDRRDPRIIWSAALFVAGFSESMGEMMLFSIGSPGSLLFMLAAASLVMRPKLATHTMSAGSGRWEAA